MFFSGKVANKFILSVRVVVGCFFTSVKVKDMITEKMKVEALRPLALPPSNGFHECCWHLKFIENGTEIGKGQESS